MSESDNKLLVYSFDDKELEIFMQDDNAWFTQKSISRLFNIDVSGVTRHLGNVFESGELDENNNVQKMHIVNSKQPVKVYSLDAVISVGYRVNSQQATKFRIWATGLLKQYIRDGYVLNEAVLKNDPEKLNELAAKIRELRHTEKNVFAKVRECFKLSATDYEPSSAVLRSFYALLQDKFHHAITKMTASKLVMDRADSSVDNMGLVSFKELIPTKQEPRVGRKYLTENEYLEIKSLHDDRKWKDNKDLTWGEWVKPVWPSNRSVQGSIPTPYIFDDRCQYEDAGEALLGWYNEGPEKREEYGEIGRKWVMSDDAKMTSKHLSNIFMDSIDTTFEKWTPRERYTLEVV